MDELKSLLQKQRKLSENWIDYNNLTLKDQEKFHKEVCLAAMAEMMEVLNEINWKPWKKKKKQIDLKHLEEELIDVLHFWLELCLIWGISSKKIIDTYNMKNKVNHQRIKDKY